MRLCTSHRHIDLRRCIHISMCARADVLCTRTHAHSNVRHRAASRLEDELRQLDDEMREEKEEEEAERVGQLEEASAGGKAAAKEDEEGGSAVGGTGRPNEERVRRQMQQEEASLAAEVDCVHLCCRCASTRAHAH